MKKLSNDNRKKMERNRPQNNESKGNNRAKENRGKVYRSRVSSADVNRNRDQGYHRAYGFKPIWWGCLLYTSPSPRDLSTSRMPSSA